MFSVLVLVSLVYSCVFKKLRYWLKNIRPHQCIAQITPDGSSLNTGLSQHSCPGEGVVHPHLGPSSTSVTQASRGESTDSRQRATPPQLRAATDTAPLHRSVSQHTLV